MSHSRNRWISLTLVAGLAIGASSAAFAHVDVGVNIGVPGFAVEAPPPVYVQPAPMYEPAPPPAVVIAPGWYDDRYYDGRRYWERREWERHHDDWREARDGRGPHGDWHDNGWHGHGHDDHGHDDHGHDH
jgi:asparagine N-glycosylation enzyme membrane subunit Stt3